jgi:hypothetical protein
MTDEYTPTVEEVRASADWGAFTDPAEFDRMIAAVERAAAVKALRDAADAIIADLPYGFGMRPDGTEDKEASAYAEGLHVANVTVSTYADRIENGESAWLT